MKVRRLVLLAAFVLALALISNVGGVASYGFFFAVALIPFVSLAYLVYVYLVFSVYQDIETRNIVAGKPIPYSFILSNERHIAFTSVAVRLFSDFSYVEDVPDNQEFAVFPGDKLVFSTKLVCKYRGDYDIGVEKLVITDFLGLFRLSYKMPQAISAIVMLRIEEMDSLGDIPEIEAAIQSIHREEENEVDIVVRDYIPGDPMRLIHWKASAASGELKVRSEVGIMKQRLLLLLDSGRASDDPARYIPLEDRILTRGVALLYYFVRRNVPVELAYQNKGLVHRQVAQMTAFSEAYEELSALFFSEENALAELIHDMAVASILAQASVIFLVIRSIDEDVFGELARLALMGKTVVAYVAGMTEEELAPYAEQGTARLRVFGDTK